mgnify:CR=1 FL=1
MKREPSGETERMGRRPVTLRLRSTAPEATSYTNRRFVESPIIRLPDGVAMSPAKKLASAGAGLMGLMPAGCVGGGEMGSRTICPLAVS